MDAPVKSKSAAPTPGRADGLYGLDELADGVHGPVEVMVCRKWEAANAYGKFLSTEFLVSDAKGTIVQCSACRSVAHCFANTLDEGKVYTLMNFAVVPNKDSYRVCRDNRFIIQLEGNTVVRHSAERSTLGFTRYPFQFARFEEICFVDHKFLIDIIGSISTSGSNKTTRGGSSFLDCYLLNERGTSIRVTLWGNHCSELVGRPEASDPTFTVIFTGLNIKEYRGDVYLSTTSATLIYTDPGLPHIANFKEQLRKSPARPTTGPKLASVTELLSRGRDEKAARKKGKRMTPATFLCTATIKTIRTKNRWYYYSCSLAACRKGITRNGGNFFCESCNQTVPFPQTRFKLQMDVEDESGTTVVTLFDDVAEKIVHKDADTLLREAGEDVDEAILPQDIQRLVNTTHTFELKSYTYYDHGPYESFTCTAVIEPNVVNEMAVSPFPVVSAKRRLEFSPPGTPSDQTKLLKVEAAGPEASTTTGVGNDPSKISTATSSSPASS